MSVSTRKRRVWWVAAVAVGLTLAAVLVMCGRTTSADRDGAHRETRSRAAARGARALAPAEVPAWVGQPGIAARRVAGRVVFEGKPVAGAKVRLDARWRDSVSGIVAVTTTDGDGGFAFGARPALTYLVSAEQPGHVSASALVALADPKSDPEHIVLELGRCQSRLYGKVIDASANPVPGARVELLGAGGVDAAPSGAYSLCVPTGDFGVLVDADGYGAIQSTFRLFGELEHDFELVPEAVLAGEVVDESANPVAGAYVIATPAAAEGPRLAARSAVTDHDGRFRIATLVPGMFQLSATANGAGTAAPRVVLASLAGGPDIRLVVTALAQITGRVVMAGVGLAGARVSIEPVGAQSVAASYSQPDGSFALAGVPYGVVTLVAAPHEVETPRTLAVDRARIADVTIEVSRRATLRGRVLQRGQPIASADVTCTLASPPTVRSNARGEYVFEGLPAGVCNLYAQDLTRAKAFSPYRSVEIAARGSYDVDLDLTAGANVTGVVLNDDGAPVPGVYVMMISYELSDQCEAMTDQAGRFDCFGLLGGARYHARVYPGPGGGEPFAAGIGATGASTGDGELSLLSPAVPRNVVDVPPGNGTTSGVKIVISRKERAIRGKVVDDNGAGVADAHVEALGTVRTSAMGPSTRTDGSGEFELRRLAPGNYTLYARSGDGSEAALEGVAAGTTGTELKLVRAGTITGELVGFEAAPVVVARRYVGATMLTHDAILDGNRFTIIKVPPGTYTVDALGRDDADRQSIEVSPGATVHVTLRSRGHGDIAGQLVEFATNTPVPGVRCEATMATGEAGALIELSSKFAFTDDSGNFRLRAPIGRVRVTCFPYPAPFSLGSTYVDLTATAAAQVTVPVVRVVSPPGDPGFDVAPAAVPVTVRAIEPNGAATSDGLAVGDQITTVDGASIAALHPSGVMALARNHRPGTVLTLGVTRGGQSRTVTIKVGK
jgi:protocatechuate 3,4-dioxygenase beta subunit